MLHQITIASVELLLLLVIWLRENSFEHGEFVFIPENQCHSETAHLKALLL